MDIECLSMGIFFADVACTPIDRLPRAGELVPTQGISLNLGGCAANTAIDLAKVGARVGVAGCVGRDPFGDYIASAMRVDRVATDGLHQTTEDGTAATMMVNVDGEDRRFISTPGANRLFTVDHVPEAWLRQAQIIYIGGFLVMPGLETDALVQMLRTARARGARTVLDVVLIDSRDFWPPLERVLPEVDVFLPNDDEAAAVTGLSDPIAQAERFRAAGAKCVVITRGREGCILVSDTQRLRTGVYPIDFVGGAGSGDAFDAGYIAGMLRGEDEAGCLRWGSALGASAVRSVATTDAVFTREEALAFMEEHELPIETF